MTSPTYIYNCCRQFTQGSHHSHSAPSSSHQQTSNPIDGWKLVALGRHTALKSHTKPNRSKWRHGTRGGSCCSRMRAGRFTSFWLGLWASARCEWSLCELNPATTHPHENKSNMKQSSQCAVKLCSSTLNRAKPTSSYSHHTPPSMLFKRN